MGVKYSDTIERMRWAGKLKNDSAVARVLSVTPQALSNYKKRGELPTDLVVRFSGIYNLSLDWLINGEGDVYRIGFEPPESEHGIPSLHEEVAAVYGRGRGQYKCLDITTLSPEHLIYMGKLLKILDEGNKSSADTIRCSIDAFYKSILSQKKAVI